MYEYAELMYMNTRTELHVLFWADGVVPQGLLQGALPAHRDARILAREPRGAPGALAQGALRRGRAPAQQTSRYAH